MGKETFAADIDDSLVRGICIGLDEYVRCMRKYNFPHSSIALADDLVREQIMLMLEEG